MARGLVSTRRVGFGKPSRPGCGIEWRRVARRDGAAWLAPGHLLQHGSRSPSHCRSVPPRRDRARPAVLLDRVRERARPLHQSSRKGRQGRTCRRQAARPLPIAPAPGRTVEEALAFWDERISAALSGYGSTIVRIDGDMACVKTSFATVHQMLVFERSPKRCHLQGRRARVRWPIPARGHQGSPGCIRARICEIRRLAAAR
jgi:hypothetical protein